MADETKPVELLLFDYLNDLIKAAQPGEVLYELELHDTVYQKIVKVKGVRISEAVGDIVPRPGGNLEEWDVSLRIVCFVRVEGKDFQARAPAMQACFTLQKEIVRVLLADQTLGDRVCNSYIGRIPRGYDSMEGTPYAVANIPLTINPSGADSEGRY